MNHTPEALQLARELDTKAQALGCPLDRFSDALRQQHTRIAELEAENKSLRALASGGIDLFERYSTFKAKCAELEAMLDAVGAGGVGASIQPPVQPDTAPAAWAICSDDGTAIRLWSRDKATAQEAADKLGLPLVVLYAAPQQPVQQEPVAWRVHPFDYGVGYKGVYALTEMPEQVEMWQRKGWKVEPLYTAPQPTENLRCKSTQKRLATLWGYVKQEPARQPLPADTYTALAHRIATRFTYSTDRSFCEYYFAIHTLEQFVRAIEQAHGITGGQQ